MEQRTVASTPGEWAGIGRCRSEDLPKEMPCEPSGRLTLSVPGQRREIEKRLQELGIVCAKVLLPGDQ